MTDQLEMTLELEAGIIEGLDEEEVFMERLVANPIHVYKLVKRALKFTGECFPQILQSFCKTFFNLGRNLLKLKYNFSLKDKV